MRTALAHMPVPSPQARRLCGPEALAASTGSVAFEGIAVSGRVFRILGLVLLLILAILPG
ncbi:hypothetical protein BSZ35_14735 [Salinibacter sp. 10B]|nr:hypothetical protein BSZ35_14735 [Salinibacter sp. 10B]